VALRRGRHGVPRTHRLRWGLAASLVVVLVFLQLSRTTPEPVVHSVAPHLVTAATTVPGDPPALPWPATGEAAVAVPGLGLVLQSGAETPVPIASLTKIMTAYLVLKDHPLAPTAQGPGVSMTVDDQNEATEDEDGGATSVPVQAGEVLTERQLLNGLLVHSANNFADVLAIWDSGSITAFVARMNAMAVTLGMHETHYADPNGLSSSSMSSAGDQLRIAMRAMAIPTFAAVVSQTSINLPIAGVIPNYVSSIGSDGIIGVKSGFTQAAMGCLVLAADRMVDGEKILVMAAVTGQPGLIPLNTANSADIALLDATAGVLHERPVITSDTRVASVEAPWLRNAVPADTTRGVTLLEWPGDVVRTSFTPARVRVDAPAGTLAGTLLVSDRVEQVSVAVRTTTRVMKPTLTWRLKRG
jgi:serine-type D-Ala-D-Ala carboxypeptidase (penicillin-binding protein 5/6)